ncbi:MAG: DNA translocase FtsK [Candidatus Omnitrophota bacterium]|jgi:S-DNA-T family DNA segregation ATPase FtsK/SpoIIIE
MKKERINEIWGVFFLLLGLLTFASLFFYHAEDIAFYSSRPTFPVANYTGVFGAYLAFGLFLVFGISAFVIPFVFLLWAECFFLQKVPERKLFKFVGLAIALLSIATIVTITVGPQQRFVYGGAFGYVAGNHLLRYFGRLGSYILAGSALLLSLLLATDFLLYPLFRAIVEKFQAVFSSVAGWFPRGSKKNGNIAVFKREQERQVKELKQKEKEKERPAPRIPDIPLKIKTYQPTAGMADDKPNSQSKNLKVNWTSPGNLQSEENRCQDKTKVEKKPKEEPKEPVKKLAFQPVAIRTEPSDKAGTESGGEAPFKGVIGSQIKADVNYQFPSVDLLKRPKEDVIGGGDDLAANSKAIEATLAEFEIEVKVVEVEQGPKITLYEILPAPGVRANSIAAYEDDISMALRATSIRMIIPIPGKQTIGIEVPNSVSRPILVREMIENPDFRSQKCMLPLILGKDTGGKPMIADLAAMPHILIAGTTGSGKTVCINSIIAGFLYHCTPSQLKLVMVDPKMVELAVYNKIPHMLSPVVTDVRKAANTLNWVVMEMEKRYRLFATVGVRNIAGFNTRELSEEGVKQVEAAGDSENVVPASIPYIVVIIDELADLMLVAQDKVETAITRLAQLSRAVGIHLILATQRPSVDVITGVIKANFPARVAFKVASVVDSRTILDNKGADKLLGRGDMLFIQPGSDNMIRGQAPLIEDDEINRIVAFTAQQGKPEYHSEIQSAQNSSMPGGTGEKDEIFDEAKRIVLTTRQASTSYLQRRLRLGYSRAARVVDQLEAAGVIGPQDGAKPREILLPNPVGDYSEAAPVDSESNDEDNV